MGELGRRHKGGHKSKASRDKIEHAVHVFGSMSGEISPYIVFCGFCQNAQVWVQIIK